MDSDAVNISRFKSYHHYLDSLIAAEDIRYLQDGELARLIAELGYRGAGRTLTEKEYLEEVERIEMAKRLKEINENAEQAGDLLGANPEDSQMVSAIKQRYKDNKEGRMNSLLFVYIETETEKLSGHVDLTARIQSENFLPYLTGSKQLLPSTRDLSYFSWQKNKLRHGKSDNWRLHGDEASLSLEHLASGARYCAVPRLRGNTAPWKHLDTKEKHVKIHCLDIKLR